MGDIKRDSDTVELSIAPEFSYGERVVSRYTVRNDGTYVGKDVGELLVSKGDVGFVASIGSFLQQYYIYAVEFIDTGHRVGMRGHELISLDHLPAHVVEALGPEKIERLRTIRPGAEAAAPSNITAPEDHDVRVA